MNRLSCQNAIKVLLGESVTIGRFLEEGTNGQEFFSSGYDYDNKKRYRVTMDGHKPGGSQGVSNLTIIKEELPDWVTVSNSEAIAIVDMCTKMSDVMAKGSKGSNRFQQEWDALDKWRELLFVLSTTDKKEHKPVSTLLIEAETVTQNLEEFFRKYTEEKPISQDNLGNTEKMSVFDESPRKKSFVKLIITATEEAIKDKRSRMRSVSDSLIRAGYSHSYKDFEISTDSLDKEEAQHLSKSLFHQFSQWPICPIQIVVDHVIQSSLK